MKEDGEADTCVGRPANEHRPKKEYGFRKALQNPTESEILIQTALQNFPESSNGISHNPLLLNISSRISGIMLRTHSGSVCLGSNPGKATIFRFLEGPVNATVCGVFRSGKSFEKKTLAFLRRTVYTVPRFSTRSDGEIGRHVCLRCICREAWGFESPSDHHLASP